MFAHEFMRNALIAGHASSALACGLVGYFVVLRAQVFAGDALSHVAFTGALAAAVARDRHPRSASSPRPSSAASSSALLGDRARADDVAIGSVFAWTLGLGVLFLSIFTTKSSAGNGTAGVRVLFGSIFGLSTADVRISVALAVVASILLLAIARPLLFASLDPAVAAARGVPVRALGLGLPRARRPRRRPGQPGGRRAAPARPARRARRRRAQAHHQSVPRARSSRPSLSVGSVWLGLTLSYVFPTLPPSSMIIASAVGIYLAAVAATAAPVSRARYAAGRSR